MDHGAVADDRLRLVFTCCHPALSMEARVALTLKVVAGLATDEVARMFLVGEATMSQRLLRAKKRVANAGIPYKVPEAADLPERLDGVLAVVYLVFTAGVRRRGGARARRGGDPPRPAAGGPDARRGRGHAPCWR